MNNILRSLPGVCLAVVMGMAGTNFACADTLLNVTLTQDVGVGSVTLLPGNYVIRELNGDHASPILFIHPTNGSDVTVAVQRAYTPRQEAATQTKVVLRPVAGGYQLDTLWIAGQEVGYRFYSLIGRE